MLIEKIIEGINEQPVEERDATTIFALNYIYIAFFS